MSQHEGPAREKQEKILKVLFIGFAAVPVLYFAVCVVLLRRGFRPIHPGFAPLTPANYNILRIVLAVISIVEALFVLNIRRAIDSGNIFGPVKWFFNQLTESKTDDMSTVANFNISIYAFCVSVAIYGMILFLLNGTIIDTYMFFILSEILFLVFVPAKAYINKLIAVKENSVQE
jgi:hypothetical protein